MADAESDSEVEDELLLFLLLRRRRRRRRRAQRRQTWCRPWILRRKRQGAFNNLVRELDMEDHEQFRLFHRLDRESFQDVLSHVEPYITKENTVMRSSISASERLSLTLRFLATGESFQSLAMQYRVGDRTVSNIVDETCQALFLSLKDETLKMPTSPEDWRKIANEFYQRWNYPCCVGAVDGKHIAIKQPDDSGSEYFNYKHFFSVILLAVVDANYKFIYVDVGAPGRAGDAGVFNESTINRALLDNSINLPPPEPLEGIAESNISYHLVGDDAFSLQMTMMKPYPHRNLDKKKRIFNYRLSRVRRVSENSFGILGNRFRVFLTPINLNPDKVTNLILAACCLHNYMVDKNKHTYLNVLDVETGESHEIAAGAWRYDNQLIGIQTTQGRNATNDAKRQRELLSSYFSSEYGAVPWQEKLLGLE